jgi:hypothetical protein
MHTTNTHRTSFHPGRRRGRLAAVFALVSTLVLLAAACGSSGGGAAGGSSTPTVAITSPTDGSPVGASFPVRLAINFPIGDPGTGRDHVHLYYDGNMADGEYGIAYADTFTVTGLSPGEHKVQAVVAHADHSITSSRSKEITVDVTGDSGPGTTGTPPTTSSGNVGY